MTTLSMADATYNPIYDLRDKQSEQRIQILEVRTDVANLDRRLSRVELWLAIVATAALLLASFNLVLLVVR